MAIEDTTEVRKAKEEGEALLAMERQARKRAEQADRIKDEFLAKVSHELRGPLNAIASWLDVLRAGGMDEATLQRALAAIERGVKSQARLIEELLDYSRMVAGKLRLAPRQIDLVPVAEAAAAAIRTAAEAKGIRLKLAGESKAAMVHGDRDRLYQVFWNLLSNAVKFTPRGGRVEVWIGRVGAFLQVRVSDTGVGIHRDFLPHVFERFRQADGMASRRQDGLGLGLAIVKELVELHGGAVQADSPGEGQGTTVTVALPIPVLLMQPTEGEAETSPKAPSPETARDEMERAALAGVRLLVVEDEADSRDMLVTVLERCGAEVNAAASAGEAMEALQRATPDVLVCDIGLPGEDGHDLIRKVRAIEAAKGGRIPALALTAYAEETDRRKAMAAGFDGYLSKPVSSAELVAMVAVLAGPRAGRSIPPP